MNGPSWRHVVPVLRAGNGTLRIDARLTWSVHVAGTGATGYDEDGGPAKLAKLSGPKGSSWAADNGLYLDHTECRTIRRIDLEERNYPDRCGNGQHGDGPDCDPMKSASLDRTESVLGADGTVYIAESENHRIRMLK